MTLKDIKIGKSAVVTAVGGEGALRQHFLDMGVIPGAEVTVVKYAPLGDPVELLIQGYELTLRLDDAAKIVAEKREENLKFEHVRLTAEEKDEILKEYHPDRITEQFTEIKIGPNKGEKAPIELVEMLQAKPRLAPEKVDLDHVDYETDVLVIGGGGAGTAAAIMASEAGAKVLLATKLRVGDANTMMAEGGIQAADKPNDSPAQHYLDAFGGGHFDGKPELVYTLVNKAPSVIKWLNDLGVEFDKEADGTMVTTHGGGTSRKRMHACKDYSGAEIMRTLRDETFNRPDRITVVDFTAAIEIIKNDKGEAVRKDAKYGKQYLEGKYGADPYLKKIIDWGNVNA